MSTAASGMPALAPVREALLGAAVAYAQQVRAEAAVTAAATLAQAREQVASILAEAHREGAADAAAAQAAALASARREARAAVLRARREVYEQLRAHTRRAVADLQRDPGYADLRSRLSQAVWRTLGGDAAVRDADGGGVIGVVAGRRMDCSLASFADRAVDELAGDLFGPPAGSPDGAGAP